MNSFLDDMTTDLNHASRPMNTGLAYAWEATPDVAVTRRHTEAPSPADAVGAAKDAVARVQHRVTTLQRLFEVSKKDITALYDSLGDVTKSLGAPKAELDMARLEIERLKQQNASIVKQAQEQSKRADAAEKISNRLVAGKKPVEALRYAKDKILARSDSDGELGGLAMLIGMVADDLERLEKQE